MFWLTNVIPEQIIFISRGITVFPKLFTWEQKQNQLLKCLLHLVHLMMDRVQKPSNL